MKIDIQKLQIKSSDVYVKAEFSDGEIKKETEAWFSLNGDDNLKLSKIAYAFHENDYFETAQLILDELYTGKNRVKMIANGFFVNGKPDLRSI